jgi:hypothetical protein
MEWIDVAVGRSNELPLSLNVGFLKKYCNVVCYQYELLILANGLILNTMFDSDCDMPRRNVW